MHNDHTTFGPVDKKALPEAAAYVLPVPPKISARLPLSLGTYGLSPPVLAPKEGPGARRLLLVYRYCLSCETPKTFLPGISPLGDFRLSPLSQNALALPPGKKQLPKPKGEKRLYTCLRDRYAWVSRAFADGILEWPYLSCPAKVADNAALLQRGVHPLGLLRCRRNTCLFCASLNAFILSKAVETSNPLLSFSVTGLFDNWRDNQAFMNGMSRYIYEKTGHRPNWAWAVEPNPEGTGYHSHGYSHSPLDARYMTDYALAHGAGRVEVKPVPPGTTARYFGYPIGTLRLEEYSTREQAAQALQAYRQLNGTHQAHHSREFFGYRQGNPITEKEARHEAVRQHRDRGPATPRRYPKVNRPKVNRPEFLGRPTTPPLGHPLSREAFNQAMADDEAKRKPFQPHYGPSGLSGVPEAIGIDPIRVNGRVFGYDQGSFTTMVTMAGAVPSRAAEPAGLLHWPGSAQLSEGFADIWSGADLPGFSPEEAWGHEYWG